MSPAAPADQTTRKRSVLLIDDHPIVRQGLSQLVNQQPDLMVTAEAASAREALELIGQNVPDVAVVDISLDDRSGIELIKDLRTRQPNLPILALSMHDESLYAERALRAGAKGYIMKHEATEKVMNAIRKVLDHQVYLSEKMSSRLLDQFVSAKPGGDESPLGRLSDRELEIFSMIGRGLGTREIANKLYLSIKTVEAHREHIKEKLKLKSGTELMRMAVQYALESPKRQ
jgi:DNA-binding NarL/FixJ family response regulator